MARLDQERQERLEPQRVKGCKDKLESLGYEVRQIAGDLLEFTYKGNNIKFWPYSGWHSGKGIKDGRGFSNLLRQIERDV